MDIYCPICAEPWDIDTFHDVAQEQDITFTEATRNFKTKGCEAIEGVRPSYCQKTDDPRALAMSVASELLGDDIDGLASIMDDFEAVGLI